MADALDVLRAAEAGKPLVLVDVGSSGGAPAIWRPLGRHATYVGFDPDSREVREIADGQFARAIYVNKAVAAAAQPGGTVHFFLTRSPYCSSTLRPDSRITESFLSAEKFIVEGETTASVTTVADALRGVGLTHLDWLKVDTQGTDLQIFRSLPDPMRRGVLAADLEPGLRGAYVNEELFSDVHGTMLREGFWLSRMNVLGFPRMRKATLDDLAAQRRRDLTEQLVTASVRRTPGWVECRYLRTLESLAERGAETTRRDYLVLWSFAFADQQFGYCLDVAAEFARRYSQDPLAAVMTDAPLAQIDDALAEAQRGSKVGIVSWLRRRMRSILSHPGSARTGAPGVTRPVGKRSPDLVMPV